MENEQQENHSKLREISTGISAWFHDFLHLEDGLSREGTIIAIKNNKEMRGANAWLLMCSIMIAALGLDLDSAAVIIGAMLISPLMSPILGIGLAIGINDRSALWISLKHFGIAIVIALLTSSLYFYITPLGQPTAEILKRTQPNLLDGLVAVFGGLAGIISVTRKDQSNAIPGVAIATALMPPLCVSGFGIANGNWSVMLNSFYLFFLNSFFIALTTYIIIRLLRFPYKAHIDEKEAFRTKIIIAIFSAFLIFPSISILKKVYHQQERTERANLFVQQYFPNNGIDFSVVEGDSSNQLIVELLGKTVPQDSITIYDSLLHHQFQLPNTNLTLIQNNGISIQHFKNMQMEVSNLRQIAHNLEEVNIQKDEQTQELEFIKQKLDSLDLVTTSIETIGSEIKVLFPKLLEIGYGNIQKYSFQKPSLKIPVYTIHWDLSKPKKEKKKDEEKLYNFLKKRTALDTLQLISF